MSTLSESIDLPRSDTGSVFVDPVALRESLADHDRPIQYFRDCLDRADRRLAERFRDNVAVEKLVRQRVVTVDEVILAAWQHFAADSADGAALVAVGGYGRGELHPHSDIDLMVLVERTGDVDVDESIGQFLTFLWDIGLEVGHSVRTLDDCETQARNDLTIVTTLMEARLLSGSSKLFEALTARIDPSHMWDSAEYFRAKLDEQTARHRRYDDTA